MSKVCIVAVEYLEKSWQQTKADIEASGEPVCYVKRKPDGVGSLAEALNRGFGNADSEFVWFLTNVGFEPTVLARLINNIGNHAAIHPAFDSDHAFLQKTSAAVPVPFVEFTAPLVRSDVFRQFPLDEKMPYVGHDVDWGFRVRQAGWTLSVDQSCTIRHTYNRHMKPDPITERRKKFRNRAVIQTERVLERKYGRDWKTAVGYHGKI